MADTALAQAGNGALLERVVIGNDLSKLSAAERMAYYSQLCHSLGLNPLTRPFQYITLSGRLTLYATKDATEQLRKKDKISITKLESQTVGDVYIVTAYAKDAEGREDSATGAVPLPSTSNSEAIANAMMKAETKAKRRATLSICGLGILDETDLGTIQHATAAFVDPDTGELVPPPPVPEVFKVGMQAPAIPEAAEPAQPSFAEAEASERMNLIDAITERMAFLKLKMDARKDFFTKYLGGASMEKADLASLRDLLGALKYARN